MNPLSTHQPLRDSKFIQIATDENGICALDNEGRVWFFSIRDRIWRALTAKRDPRDEEERNAAPARERS